MKNKYLIHKLSDQRNFIERRVKTYSRIKKYYYDFNKPCKYRSCLHIKEDGCSIIEEVNKGKIPEWRYQNYLKFMEETKE